MHSIRSTLDIYFQEKIVNFGDDSGCPFVHFDESNLLKFLENNYADNLSEKSIRDILNLVQRKEYCLACTHLLTNVNNDQQDKLQDGNVTTVERPSDYFSHMI